MCRHLLISILILSGGLLRGASSEAAFWAFAELGDFSPAAYREAVEKILRAYETDREDAFADRPTGVVALKVYTAGGPGLATPPNLVRALIAALEERGYARENQRIVDLRAFSLRESGFLPPLSEGGDTFFGVPVVALESGQYYEREYFYESPLPPRTSPLAGRGLGGEGLEEEAQGEDRKSFLPVNLLFEVDFWINLPVVSDHPHLGLSGALVNGTLWNASNTFRFFRSRSSGPVAVANLAAIPELRETWRLNLVSLERGQFIGGPRFHSLYTFQEPLLVASNDPVALDTWLIDRINRARRQAGFRLLPRQLPYLLYAEQLGVGRRGNGGWGQPPSRE